MYHQVTMGTGSFPGVKRLGRGADHPPPPKRRDHERGAIPLLTLWAFVACYRESFAFIFTFFYQVLHSKILRYARRVHVCVFIRISEQTAIIFLYSINWLVFITGTQSVYWAVRNEFLYTIQVHFRL